MAKKPHSTDVLSVPLSAGENDKLCYESCRVIQKAPLLFSFTVCPFI